MSFSNNVCVQLVWNLTVRPDVLFQVYGASVMDAAQSQDMHLHPASNIPKPDFDAELTTTDWAFTGPPYSL